MRLTLVIISHDSIVAGRAQRTGLMENGRLTIGTGVNWPHHVFVNLDDPDPARRSRRPPRRAVSMASAAGDGLHCVVAVGMSAAIALSRRGMDVTVLERSPARAVEGGGGLGVDVALLQQVTGLRDEPPVLHGIDRDTTAWHLPQGWLEDQAVRYTGATVRRGTEVTAVDPGNDQRASVMTADGGRVPR